LDTDIQFTQAAIAALLEHIPMKRIDEARLETDLQYRVNYLAEFVGFSPEDESAVSSAAELLAPAVPALVDAVYDKLFKYDATKRHLVPRQSGYGGKIPDSLESLEMHHEMIQFRKNHLARYLVTLVTQPFDAKMFAYLNRVGEIHTPKAGSARLDVPLVQMNALLGFVADALTATILSSQLDQYQQQRLLRASGKLMWIQNDLISRHYQTRPTPQSHLASTPATSIR
jgi:hypothetical protein